MVNGRISLSEEQHSETWQSLNDNVLHCMPSYTQTVKRLKLSSTGFIIHRLVCFWIILYVHRSREQMVQPRRLQLDFKSFRSWTQVTPMSIQSCKNWKSTTQISCPLNPGKPCSGGQRLTSENGLPPTTEKWPPSAALKRFDP